MEDKKDPDPFKRYIEGLDLGMPSPFLLGSDVSMGGENLVKRVKMVQSFDGLNVLTTFRAKDIGQIMALLIMRGLVNPDTLEGNVVDFGMGTGPGAYVLNHYGGNITGVDPSETLVQTAIEEGILPKDRALVQDGFAYLNGLQPASLDFIGAFMMCHRFPHVKLYEESERVLKSGGQLLITGGLIELKKELQSTVGRYGKIEDVITVHDDDILGNVAFIYTKR